MQEILNMEIFGLSVRWLITFAVKGCVIYLFVRLLTGITKYLFYRSMHKQGKIVLDETKVSFMRRIIVTAIYIIGIAAFLSLIPGMEKVSNSILASAGIENVLFTQMIVVGLWNMLTVFIFMAIVDRLSRRFIFILALSVMIVGTVALIASFMISGIPVVALIGMLFYILGFESVPGPLFYVMATQDFPKELVAQGLSVSNIVLYVLNITISMSFPLLTSAMGAGYTFVILCGFQILSLMYFGFTMKEK